MFGAVSGDFEAFLRWGENPPGAKTRDTLHTRVTGHTGLLAARVTVCHSDALMIKKAQRGGGESRSRLFKQGQTTDMIPQEMDMER